MGSPLALGAFLSSFPTRVGLFGWTRRLPPGRHLGNESQQTRTDTICPYCGVGCTLTVHVQDERIVKVTSPIDHDVTRGHLCIKGRFGWEFVNRRQDR